MAYSQVLTTYVDFGAADLPTSGPDANGNLWNNVTESISNLANLISSDGKYTGVALSITGFGASQGANKNGTRVPDVTALGNLGIVSATSDSLYVSGSDVITVKLSNLAPDGIYRLSLFASREIDQRRVTRYDVNGCGAPLSQTLQTSGTGLNSSTQPTANRSGLAVFENLNSVGGIITISVSRDVGDYAYLGALRLELMNQPNSPPSAGLVISSGSPRVGSRLVGSYVYSDPEEDAEATPGFVWERASSPGSEAVRVSGELPGTTTYDVQTADQGCYLRFGVIPSASTGRQQGGVSYSGWYGPVHASGTLATFHIGNSFTRWSNIPLQLGVLTKSASSDIATGFQLHDGQALRFDWDHGVPGAALMSGTPSRVELATGTWDAVVLQPMSREWLAMDDFKNYAKLFYDLADANGTQVYLFDYWPYVGEAVETQTSINSAFEQVRASISVGGRKPALVIPVGEVFRAVAAASGSGGLAGIDRSALYLDDRHPSNLGGYISALTHYATIFKRSPVGLTNVTVNAGYENDMPMSISPDVCLRLQQIVWSVVSSYPNSGVSAFSGSVLPPITPVYVHHDPATFDPSLLVYAFGPAGADGKVPAENLPRSRPDGAGGELFEYRLNTEAEQSGVTYSLEWSSDLVNWSNVPPSGSAVVRVGAQVKVTMTGSAAGQRRFMRVFVRAPN
ncbi:hypothetical protein [Luteolibacter sp. LG18]|uniref:hypothetical protein n=1 Tax=Luteolibacter sp. LG18 TaxID=2819286 RepID=UPI0030C71E6F